MGDAGEAGDGRGSLTPWTTSPGVSIEITDLAFTDAVATVSFTLTDGSGIAVDPAGSLTPGSIELGFVLAQLTQDLDGSAGQYTAYTTITATSPITGASAIQGATEATGTLRPIDVAQGTYQYDVAAALTGLAPGLTQTVGAYALRTGAPAISSMTFSARPDHGAVIAREVVTAGASDFRCARAAMAATSRVAPQACRA